MDAVTRIKNDQGMNKGLYRIMYFLNRNEYMNRGHENCKIRWYERERAIAHKKESQGNHDPLHHLL